MCYIIKHDDEVKVVDEIMVNRAMVKVIVWWGDYNGEGGSLVVKCRCNGKLL